jgi:hypothetical protein
LKKGNGNTQPINPYITSAIQGIKVYRVLSRMMLNFEFPASGDVSIKLMDITGRTMDEMVVHNGTKASFNVKDYPLAIYIPSNNKGQNKIRKIYREINMLFL